MYHLLKGEKTPNNIYNNMLQNGWTKDKLEKSPMYKSKSIEARKNAIKTYVSYKYHVNMETCVSVAKLFFE